MKIKYILLVLILVSASVFMLSVSDSSLMTELKYEQKPYYIGENELIANIGGLPLYYDEFRYHAYTVLTEMGLEPETADWDFTEGLSDTVVKGAIKKALRWRVLELTAMDAGIEPDENSLNTYAATIKGDWVTSRVAKNRARAEFLYQMLFASSYGQNSEKLPDDDAYIFGSQSGIIRVKSIYFSTSAPLITNKEIEAKREQAVIFASEISAGTAVFDDIMKVYGESEPDYDGYQFASGGVAAELYKAAEALNTNGSSGVVEVKDDGLYILMRLELQPDDIVMGLNRTLRYSAAASLFEKSLDKVLEIKYTAAYDKVNPEFMFR